MAKKIKKVLRGKRVTLKLLYPDINLAKVIFKAVCENRRHLRPWFPWEPKTKTVEDSMAYLFSVETKAKKNISFEYGLFLGSEYAGNISLINNSQKKSGEIGYWISKKFTRQGYVTEAVKVIEKEFFGNHNLHRIQIKCNDNNVASAGVAQKCGYVFEGLHRDDNYSDYFHRFNSTLVFSKLKSEFNKETKKK